jgi:hypothetical protein
MGKQYIGIYVSKDDIIVNNLRGTINEKTVRG